jgi:hypothetical protein
MSTMTRKPQDEPLFEARVHALVARSPQAVYAVVSDLPGCHRWSEECTGGEWIEGRPAALGSVFRGHNFRRPDVVAWAPVVRGAWTTTAEVVAAQPGRRFCWAMRTRAGQAQDSVWGYDLEPAGSALGGTRLTHHFRMGAATEGISGITAAMDDATRKRFFAEWGAKVRHDMEATVARLLPVVAAR